MFPIRISLIEVLLFTRKLLNQGFVVVRWKHDLESFMVSIMTWFPLQNVSDDHRYVVKSCLPSWLNIGFLTRLAQWMPLAKHELLTIQEHLFHPLFLMGYFVDGPLYCLITLWYLQTCLVIVISCKLKRYLLNPTPPATQFLFYVAHYVHVHKNCKNSWSFISI